MQAKFTSGKSNASWVMTGMICRSTGRPATGLIEARQGLYNVWPRVYF